MRLRTGLFVHFPFLKSTVAILTKKFLDLTDYPYWRGQISNLMLAHHAKLRLDTDYKYRKSLKETLDLIKPDENVNWQPLRIGSANDGGYLVPIEFAHQSRWVTFGLGENVEFENHLAKNNCTLDSFDHTLTRKPKKLHKKVRFHNLGISNKMSKGFVNISYVVDLAEIKNSIWCLKSDIEGSEYDFLPDLLNMQNLPQVIVIEIHGLLDIGSVLTIDDRNKILKNLRNKFFLAHVNVNNFGSIVTDGELLYPDVAELVYILKNALPLDNIDNSLGYTQVMDDNRNNPLAPYYKLLFPEVNKG